MLNVKSSSAVFWLAVASMLTLQPLMWNIHLHMCLQAQQKTAFRLLTGKLESYDNHLSNFHPNYWFDILKEVSPTVIIVEFLLCFKYDLLGQLIYFLLQNPKFRLVCGLYHISVFSPQSRPSLVNSNNCCDPQIFLFSRCCKPQPEGHPESPLQSVHQLQELWMNSELSCVSLTPGLRVDHRGTKEHHAAHLWKVWARPDGLVLRMLVYDGL